MQQTEIKDFAPQLHVQIKTILVPDWSLLCFRVPVTIDKAGVGKIWPKDFVQPTVDPLGPTRLLCMGLVLPPLGVWQHSSWTPLPSSPSDSSSTETSEDLHGQDVWQGGYHGVVNWWGAASATGTGGQGWDLRTMTMQGWGLHMPLPIEPHILVMGAGL